MATDAEVEIAAEAMMRADWASSARSRPPDADVKSYYAMARAALLAVDGVAPAEFMEHVKDILFMVGQQWHRSATPDEILSALDAAGYKIVHKPREW